MGPGFAKPEVRSPGCVTYDQYAYNNFNKL